MTKTYRHSSLAWKNRVDESVKGLELCESYFREEGLPALKREFGKGLDRMAAGLVGDGSECYGYDDPISQDHDWGPGFCIWLARDDYEAMGSRIQEIYDALPKTFMGYGPRLISPWGEGRVGVLEIGAFYSRFIGKYQPPGNLDEWLLLPENALAAATNGKVFHDPPGKFTGIRNALLDFYPEDVRLKKIASRCMTIGQAGQYNFPRCVKRREFYAARYSEVIFCADVMSMVFLLNKRYAPFSKWVHRAVRELPLLGIDVYDGISALVGEHDDLVKMERMEAISQVLIHELRRQSLSNHNSDYLPDHGPVVQQAIQDSRLRERNVWIG